MKQFIFLSFLAIAGGSCHNITGSGNIVTEKRETGNFTAISAGSSFEVEIKNGPVTAVEVEADDNVTRYIETKVEGGELKIKTKGSNMSFTNIHSKIYITAPEIRSVKASGAADIKVKDGLKYAGIIYFEASGSADIEAAVDAPEIKTEASGASSIELKGRTKEYVVVASGSAAVKSGDLLSESTTVTTSGAANAHVHASVTLKAKASGSSDINYRGNAAVDKEVSGAASIDKE